MQDLSRLTINELIALFRVKQEKAVFEEIYKRYKNMIFTYIRRFLYNQPEDIINEIMNDIFIKVYFELMKLKNPEAFKSWIFRIARNISINYIRSNKFPYLSIDNEKNSSFYNELIDPRIDLEKGYEEDDLKKAVFQAVCRLDDKIRELVILKYFHNLTYEELSEVSGISVRALKNKVKDAFESINRKLKKAGYL